MVVQRWAQRRRHAQDTRLTKSRVQAVQRAGQLQHRAHGNGASIFRFQLSRPNNKFTIRARRYIQLVARVHQAYRALERDARACHPQHLTTHAAQRGHRRLAAYTARIDCDVYGMCLLCANDGLLFNPFNSFPFMPLHAQSIKLNGEYRHQLVIGQLPFTRQKQTAVKASGQRWFVLRKRCRIKRLYLRF